MSEINTIQELDKALLRVAQNVSYYGGFNKVAQERGNKINDFRKLVKEWIKEDHEQTLETELKTVKVRNERLATDNYNLKLEVARLKSALTISYAPHDPF